MKNWYQNRMESDLTHRRETVNQGKKIYLTDDQAKVHGSKIAKCEAPKSAAEVAANKDWEEFNSQAKQVQATPKTQKPNNP